MGAFLTPLVRPVLSAAALIWALGTGSASAGLEGESAFEISQAAIGGQVGDHVLKDRNGSDLALADFRGRPLVISLIFTSCSTVCPVTTDHLRDQVKAARDIIGGDGFAVLTFGFDASGDRPAQLAAFY